MLTCRLLYHASVSLFDHIIDGTVSGSVSLLGNFDFTISVLSGGYFSSSVISALSHDNPADAEDAAPSTEEDSETDENPEKDVIVYGSFYCSWSWNNSSNFSWRWSTCLDLGIARDHNRLRNRIGTNDCSWCIRILESLESTILDDQVILHGLEDSSWIIDNPAAK